MAHPLPIVLAFIVRDGRVLLTRRPVGVHQGGRWEFPGGKVAAGETFVAALQRELSEETGVEIAVGTELAATRYAYPDREVELHLFACTLVAGEPEPRQVDAVRWVPMAALATYDFPPANAALLAHVGRENFGGSASCPKE
jgi:8-oxo-dGTP diphosphatase